MCTDPSNHIHNPDAQTIQRHCHLVLTEITWLIAAVVCILFCSPDVNECIEGNDCDEFADCKNSYGSYSCSCKDGYRGNGKECIKGKWKWLCSRSGSEVVPVFSYFLFLTLYFFSVTVTGRCSRENCDVYASCLADPLSGITNCACQIGFIGDGLKCQGVYIFTSSSNKTAALLTLLRVY